MPSQNTPIEPSAFHELQRRVDRLEREDARTAGRKLLTVDRFTTASLPAPTEGQLAIETGDDTLKYYANQEWRTVGSGSEGPVHRAPIHITNPRFTSLSGNSYFNVKALTAWDIGYWSFVINVEGKLYGWVNVPSNYSSGGAVVLNLATVDDDSAVARMQVSTKAVADGESLNPGSLTAETAQDVTMPATAYYRKEVSFTLTETLAAEDLVIVEIFHDGDHANDTVDEGDLMLVSAELEYTPTA